MIAVLFARQDSIYKTMQGCDVWDIDRDARLWPGGCPIVAHPPCRAWGHLKGFAKPRIDEKDLARWAVAQIRKYGGVLEHPRDSSLWKDQGLPLGRRSDAWGGYTVSVNQHWWGHLAAKATWLYVVGVPRKSLPPIPLDIRIPEYLIAGRGGETKRKNLPKSGREKTPPLFAAWLCDLAGRARGYQNPIDQQAERAPFLGEGGELANRSFAAASNVPLAAQAPAFDLVAEHLKAEVGHCRSFRP